LRPQKAPQREAPAAVAEEKPTHEYQPMHSEALGPTFRFAKVFWIWAASAALAMLLLQIAEGTNDVGSLANVNAALLVGLTVAFIGVIIQRYVFYKRHPKPPDNGMMVQMEWLEKPRKASLYGRLLIVLGFLAPYLVFRFTGMLPFYLALPILWLGVFYWLGKIAGAWYMTRKFMNEGLVNSLPWISFIGWFVPIAGAFLVGASIASNRFRKDTPLKFILLPTLGLIVAALSALAVAHAKHGGL
jgi:hypothetical protein